MVIDRFEGSKVRSPRILMDTMSLMQQLGVFPADQEQGVNQNSAF